MAVETTATYVNYIGDGATVNFPVGFYFRFLSDLVIYVNGVQQVVTTNYTLTGTPDSYGWYSSGGTIVFQGGSIPPAGSQIAIIRQTPRINPGISFTDGQPFTAEALNHYFDYLQLEIQEMFTGSFLGVINGMPVGIPPSGVGSWYLNAPSIAGGMWGWTYTTTGWKEFANISLL